MKKNIISRVISVIMTIALCMSLSICAFAAEANDENVSTDVVSAGDVSTQSTHETLMWTTMTTQKTGSIYVPECGLLGNKYYFTFGGDSNNYVNFTVYDSSNTPRISGSFLADGTTHNGRWKLPVGYYTIAMNTASSKTITCVVSYDR